MSLIHQRTKRRIARRGAALVEASVVVPVLVIFLGLMTYVYRSYREKITQQNSTRENAMYFASHGCQGSSSGISGFGGFGPAQVALNADDNSDAANVIGKKGDPGAQASTSRSFNQANSSLSGTVVVGGHLRRINSESHVFCNERPYDGNIAGWAQFAFGFFRTGIL